MCGRIEVKKSFVDRAVGKDFGIEFEAIQNIDTRPTQQVACIHHSSGQLEQVNPSWGIKPSWSKHIIINAQSETADTKRTFSSAYALNRCVIPCTAWFEWTGPKGDRTKHRFGEENRGVFYMAGILFPKEGGLFDMVSLTAAADPLCAEYHHRMPLLLNTQDVSQWLSLPPKPGEITKLSDKRIAIT